MCPCDIFLGMFTAFALTGLILTLIVTGLSIWKNNTKKSEPAGFFCTIGRFIDKYYWIFLLLIFAVYLFSRVLKLDSFPNGIHVDELSMAVDAKSILFNGIERSGAKYPPYFRNYGGGQNALYIYLEAFLLNFLPSTIFTIRIQAVFWGAVCLFAMFGICYEILEKHGYALMGAILVTTLPVFVMSQRFGLESYQLLPFCTIVMYFLVRAIKYGKPRDFILTGIFMGASLYSYALSYIVWPIFLLLAGIYLLYIKKISLKQIILLAVPLGVLAIPLILFQLVNFGILEPFTLGISDYQPLPIAREEDLGFSNILTNLLYFKKLFLGGEPLTYNVLPEFGTVYMFLIPFVIIGLVLCIKDTVTSFKTKTISVQPLFVFFWLAGTIVMLFIKGLNVNRVNELFLPFVVFIVIAIHRLLARNPLTLSWLAVWLGASFFFFMYFYFFMQNAVYGYHPLHTNATPGKAIERCEKYYLKDDSTHIYIQFEDIAEAQYQQVFYFAGQPGDVYSDDNPTYGNVTGKLPEEIDVNENAIYIIGNQWPHITSYLISQGFIADQTLPGYSILFKVN